jgi:hypothetical protein
MKPEQYRTLGLLAWGYSLSLIVCGCGDVHETYQSLLARKHRDGCPLASTINASSFGAAASEMSALTRE